MEIDLIINGISELVKEQKYDEALTTCLDALKREDLSREEKILILQNSITVYEALNQYLEIISTYSEIFKLSKNTIYEDTEIIVPMLLHRAEIYKRLGQIQESIDDYIYIVKNADRNSKSQMTYLIKAYGQLAYIRMSISDEKSEFQEAAKYLRTAYRLDPENIVTNLFLGIIYNKLDNREKSLKHYDRAYINQFNVYESNLDNNRFFKYRSMENMNLRSLADNRIYLSRPKDFNDPFDCILYRQMNYLDNKVFREVIDRIKAFCVSATNKSILMWSHYADSHKGFCIEYQIDRSYLDNVEVHSHFNEIDYRKDYSREEKFINIFNDAFFVKNKIWKYEKEYRLLTYNQPENYLPSPRIRSITFGLECSNSNRERVKDAVKHHSNIEFFQVDVNLKNMMKLKISKDSCN